MLFVVYYGSITLFIHSHHYSWGTITHSHFHKKSHHDTKDGGHTKQEIVYIDQISHFESVEYSYNCDLRPSQIQLYQDKIIETAREVISTPYQNISLRAPPIS
jgi:hypothetical protein